MPLTQMPAKEPFQLLSDMTRVDGKLFRVYGLTRCPCCLEGSLVVKRCVMGESVPHEYFYVTCDRDDCEGEYSGPVRNSIREAAKASNETLVAFARTVLNEGAPNPANFRSE